MAAQIGYFDTLKSVAGKVLTYLASITLTGADGKTLTVEDNSLVNQDLTTDAFPTFAGEIIGGVKQYGLANIAIANAWVYITPVVTKGGLFFITGKNDVDGTPGWWLIAHNVDNTLTTISSDNNTGLTANFQATLAKIRMYMTSGSMHISVMGWWL